MHQPAEMPDLPCPCCSLPPREGHLRRSPFVSVPVCLDCLSVWYDDAITDAKEIARRSRAKREGSADAV
jgi:hypothetical protein